MVRFLRDMVAIPSESAEEGPVIERIRQEMEATGAFDKVWTDGLGNLLGQVGKPGKGKKLIAIDAHVDTVGVGERSEWKHDPYKGKVADGKVWGRGAGDQEGAIPAMVYAAKILRDLKVDLSEFSLLPTFTVMEEDCDGLCWQYIVKEDKIRPDVVVVTDSTDCKILRGQRGRMEIGVTCLGKSCHGSMPEKGDNAVYKIAKVVREIEALNERLKGDKFLGKGTITVSYIDCKTPSLCAVPGPGLHPSRPPAHRRRHEEVGRRRSEGRRQAGRRRGQGRSAPLRPPQLHRPRLRDRKILPDVVRSRKIACRCGRR